MRLRVDELPKTGRQLALDAVEPSLRALLELVVEGEIVSCTGTVGVQRASGQRIRVTVQGRVEATRPCDRCGAPTPLALTVDETLWFVPRSGFEPDGEEVELAEEDLDLGFYDGVALESDDLIAEAFALSVPNRVTCARSDCGEALGSAEAAKNDGRASPFAALETLLDPKE